LQYQVGIDPYPSSVSAMASINLVVDPALPLTEPVRDAELVRDPDTKGVKEKDMDIDSQ
jgi:hypothetical protein